MVDLLGMPVADSERVEGLPPRSMVNGIGRPVSKFVAAPIKPVCDEGSCKDAKPPRQQAAAAACVLPAELGEVEKFLGTVKQKFGNVLYHLKPMDWRSSAPNFAA